MRWGGGFSRSLTEQPERKPDREYEGKDGKDSDGPMWYEERNSSDLHETVFFRLRRRLTAVKTLDKADHDSPARLKPEGVKFDRLSRGV